MTVNSLSARHLLIGITQAWSSDEAWASKLSADRERAHRNQSKGQRAITEMIAERVRAQGAEGLALTGSTARNRRTEISDLDYHVIGPRPRVDDLPGEVDIYAGSAEHFWKKLRGGDDFVQWTLRFGCILFDRGPFRNGLREVATQKLWPDPNHKFIRLSDQIEVAMRLIRMGDREAAQDQVRAALTAASRGMLLATGVFPLARSELPEQARGIGHASVGDALVACIHLEPSLEELEGFLQTLRMALSAYALTAA